VPREIVCVSASFYPPSHHKAEMFSSGPGSRVGAQKEGRKTVVCVCVL